MVGRWGRSNCVHAFAGGALYVQAKHKDYVGDYCLAMPMSTDAAIIFGRELFGEPKKQATTTLERKGNTITGSCVRHGKPIISLTATMEKKESTTESGFVNFHYKYLPKSDGHGLEWDPVLVMATFKTKVTLAEKGRGTLTLGNTVHDPLGEIEIVQLLSASYTEGDIYSRCQTLAQINAAHLPFRVVEEGKRSCDGPKVGAPNAKCHHATAPLREWGSGRVGDAASGCPLPVSPIPRFPVSPIHAAFFIAAGERCHCWPWLRMRLLIKPGIFLVS